MTLRHRFSTPYGFVVFCVTIYLVVKAGERAILVALTASETPESLPALLAAVAPGVINDLAMAALIAVPFAFILHHGRRWFARRIARVLAHLVFVILLGVLAFETVAAVMFWNEFAGRFNGIAVNYLIFPKEVIGNIRESFRTEIILPGIAVAALIVYAVCRSAMVAALSASGRIRHGAFHATLVATAAAAGTLAWAGPIAIGGDRAANEIAANGLHSLLRAAWTNDNRYDGYYPGMDEAEALRLARRIVAQDNTRPLATGSDLSLLRRVDNGTSPRRLNVVLVIEESFGSVYVDGLDNILFTHPDIRESISPNLVRLAEAGLFFSNIYATGPRTVYGLEALLTSFGPIPGISTARRPGSEGMNSLPSVLRDAGYRTAFLYAGRDSFDNMGTFWRGIGFDDVWDQDDIAEPGFTTIWGVADEYLFTEAIRRLDGLSQGGKPFFLGLLTVSNHRPYSYPAGRIKKSPDAHRRENGATYADWAFGDFVERARGHRWFADTIFVFIGDHGPYLSGSAQVPVDRYRVPLLFYAPAHIAAARLDTVGSSLDVAPTLLGLLGLSYESPFFGVDLRRVPKGAGRVVMAHNYSIAFGRDGLVATLEPNGTSKGYRMTLDDRPMTPMDRPDPEVLRAAIAITQTAHHMFYAGKYHRPSKD